MKAFVIERYGRKGSGRLGDMPEPELRDDDVMVRVHAAGVNLLNSKIRTGKLVAYCRSSWETTSPKS